MSKTEVSGKQLKDGSVELVDLAPEVSGVLDTLQSDVATLQTDVAAKADAGNLASVATSGSYNDLSDKPSIPSVAGLASETYVDTAVAGKADSASLASVATSGSYTDLTNKPSLFSGDYGDLANKPTIPSVVGLASETYVDTAVAGKADSASLASVATSGSYNDLADKPSIPSVAGLASETYVDTAVAAVVNSAPATLDTLKELSDALGADENFATTVAGQIGDVASDVSALDVRVTSLEGDLNTLQSASAPNLSQLGGVAITSPSSGQVLKYDGLGWVNAADSTFSGAYADLTGKPSLFSGSYTDLTSKPTLFDGAYSSLTGAPSLATVATSGSYNDLTNKPAAGASDLDGLSDVFITSAAKGHFISHNGTNFVNTRTIEADAAATVPVTIKGAASQSGNLLELQNSAGTWLTRLTSSGLLQFNYAANSIPIQVSNQFDEVMFMLYIGANSNTANSYMRLGTQVYQYTEFGFEGGTGSNGCFKIWGRADRCFAFQSPDNGAGVYTFDVTRNTTSTLWDFNRGGNSAGFNFNTSTSASGGLGVNLTSAAGANLHVVSNLAAKKGMIVKGAASQTANMFELQNSAGTAFVSVNGNFGTSLKSSAATTASLTITPGASAFAEGNAPALLINRNDGAAALIVDAMGGVLAFNKNNARLNNYIIDGYGPNIYNSDTGSLNLRAVATKKINLVTPDEGYGARSISFYHGASNGDGWTSPKWYQDCNLNSISFLTPGFGINVPIGTALGAQLHLINGAAARKGVVIRGHASQSANLLEVQNGSGTVLVQVNSTGRVGIGDVGGSSIAAIRNTQSNAVNTLVVASDVAGDVGTAALVVVKKDNNTTTGQSLIQFLTNAGVSGQGQIVANGSTQAAFASYSDARLKENIIDLPSQLNSICSLRPVEFDYKDGSGHQIGFIAQEVQEVYPDLVNENNEGILTLTGLGKNESRLIKALQELSAKVDALQAEKEALEARIAALENN
jgi:hypothetical protein